MTEKLRRTASKQVWRCTVCEFDNSILLANCEMCESNRPQKFKTHLVQQKNQEASTSVADLKVLFCLDPKCKTENDINQIQCKKCKKMLIDGLDDDESDDGEQKKEKKKDETIKIACHKCSFENDQTNVTCVNCDVKMKKRKIPRPPKVRAPKAARPRVYGPNYCQACKSYKIFTVLGVYECKCPDPQDLLPVNRTFCNFCFENLKQEQYNEHIKGCQEREKFYDIKNKTYERCTKLQIETMLYMHKKCQELHFQKQRKLEKRIQKLGYPLKDLENLYFYIVNYAPIIIHMHADKHFTFYVKDTHYRSQFETAKSSGSLSLTSRTSWQNRMFDHKHNLATNFQRVKYGTMNFTNDPHGVAACTSYGQSYFLLKEHVRDRCTMTDMDSSSPSSTICTFRFCYHLLCKLSDNQIKAAFEGSKAKEIKSAGIISAYKEIQIHGPVEFKRDIQRVYIHRAEIAINPNCMDEIKEFCKTNDLEYEEFGQIPKPILPMGASLLSHGGIVGAGFGGGFGVGGFAGVGGFGVAGGFGGSYAFGGGSIFGGAPAPKLKKPPIKYAPVTFPYSKSDDKQDDQKEDYI